ncbi:hypothetical protein NLG97_g5862 [Lecanicillium saksenae]|uniref:Uncharacterized protein n=1 Tax=Lecanicillium saksenae TaxID=468837 RepID=A0ACC1QRG2_9HYPO|nr:hypothetical protein NLG97_g5862 [Lecanicillium saksenae]
MQPLLSSILIAAAVGCLASAIPNDDSAVVWDRVPTSRELEYHDCFDKYKCAKLILPLDWWDESNKGNVTIAIIKLPAAVSADDPTFGGTVFIQPGGPGISGTHVLRLSQNGYREMLDIPGERHYELLSIDPRGTGQSKPRINCFPGFQLPMRMMESSGAGSLDLNRDALNFAIAQAKADAVQCEKVHGNFLKYIGTPNVVHDMVAILDEIERERSAAKQRPSETDEDANIELRSAKKHRKSDVARLQYMGFSYGTRLGNYFASMFPGRVGRMVLDGVCDADDYANGPDTDTMAAMMFDGCRGVGSPTCALSRETYSSGEDIKRRVWDWAAQLNEDPLFAIMDDGQRLFIRGGDIAGFIVEALYDAVSDSRALARDLDQAMSGNATGLLSRMYAVLGKLNDKCSDSPTLPLIPTDALGAITCADGENVANKSNAYWSDYLRQHMAISSPNWAFRGPFTTPEPSRWPDVPEPGHPAAPLLFMTNRYDPATPLANARAMSKNHPGSGVLVQDSMGHCLVAGGMGPCAKNILRKYFASGAVPLEEHTCQPVQDPWNIARAVFSPKLSYVRHWA